MARKSSAFRYNRLFGGALCLTASVLVAACGQHAGPTPMPTGYTYHNDVHKAPPGPAPLFQGFKDKKADAIQEKQAARLETMGAGKPLPPVRTLTPSAGSYSGGSVEVAPLSGGVEAAPVATTDWDRAAVELTARVFTNEKPTTAVYLQPGVNADSRTFGFGAALRHALQDRNIQVADTPHILILQYNAETLSVADPDRLHLTLTLLSGSKTVRTENGIYTIRHAAAGLGAPSASPAATAATRASVPYEPVAPSVYVPSGPGAATPLAATPLAASVSAAPSPAISAPSAVPSSASSIAASVAAPDRVSAPLEVSHDPAPMPLLPSSGTYDTPPNRAPGAVSPPPVPQDSVQFSPGVDVFFDAAPAP